MDMVEMIKSIVKHCINNKIVGCFDFRNNTKKIEKGKETFVLIILGENKGIWLDDKNVEYYEKGKIVRKVEIEKFLD